MSLSSLKLQSLSTELPQLDGAIQRMTLHVRFLTSSAEQIEERVLLETVNNLRRQVLAFGGRIEEVDGEIETIKRSGIRGDANAQARLANARGLSVRIDRSLLKLDAELQALTTKADERLNAPGRYGDAATVTGPIVDLVNMLQNVAEIVTKLLSRRKHSS
jgi:hypothetical protein